MTRRGRGRSVGLTTAMTREQRVHATRCADTEVFYMAGRQLAALGRSLIAAGWPADTLASVVSRAGWPDELHSDHALDSLGHASVLHSGRPAVVIVGAGAAPLDRGACVTESNAGAADNHPEPVASVKP
jgi:uroporphyrin-III C-methyltransferase